MKCDVCESEATVFLTQIINGQMTTVNLCDACSKAKGVTDETGFGLAEAFLNQPTAAADVSNVVCEACGFTAAQLKKIGRMGCPECYSAFKDGLDSLLKAMHKGTRHVGKTPRTIFPEGRSMKNIKQLREDLNTAVREERYEDAAKLKNQIDELQNQLAGQA